MKKIYLFIYRWLSTINHKDIGILYLLFGFIVGIIGIIFSIIIRVELAYLRVQVLEGNEQYFNVIITAYLILNTFSFWLLLPLFILFIVNLNLVFKKILKCQ